MGSRLLWVSQSPPKPGQRDLTATGPARRPPVVLSKTAKATLTAWTNCPLPTAPTVSGGAKVPAPAAPADKPAKFTPATAWAAGRFAVCTPPAGAVGPFGSARSG